MRIVFAGSPEAAVPTLELLASRHEVVAVVTRRPSPHGRRRVLAPTAVGARAAELGIPVIEANRLDDAVTARIAALEPDLGVIVAYGGLVREPLLSTPRLDWINLHFSLLPAYRGAAPVQRALMAGDDTTGIAVFQLVPELDAGDVLAMEAVRVPDDATAGDLLRMLAGLGATLVADVVDLLVAGTATRTPQSGAPSLAPKLTLADGGLDPHESADAVLARFRGTTPEPGAHASVDGDRLRVLGLRRALPDTPRLDPGETRLEGRDAIMGTATDPLLLTEVQPAGKRPMAAADWLRGRGGSARISSGREPQPQDQQAQDQPAQGRPASSTDAPTTDSRGTA